MLAIIILLINTAFASYQEQVNKYADLYRIDKKIINKIIQVESGGRELVYSDGCIGLMQIKHSTAEYMGYSGSVKDLYKPQNNIKYGVKYLRYLTIWFDGDIHKVLAAYNRGPNAVDKNLTKDWSKDKYVKKILEE